MKPPTPDLSEMLHMLELAYQLQQDQDNIRRAARRIIKLYKLKGASRDLMSLFGVSKKPRELLLQVWANLAER